LKVFKVFFFSFSDSAFAIGRGGVERNPVFLQPEGVPLPFPVFLQPELHPDERLTIVTPSSVVRNPEVSATLTSDRRHSGFARKIEDEEESTYKNHLQVNNFFQFF
jgi:hypothetical protein